MSFGTAGTTDFPAALRLRPGEILNPAQYVERRRAARNRLVALAHLRHVEVGPLVSLLFLDRELLLARLQELAFTEGIEDTESLEAECDAYSALLPDGGGLTAAVAVEPACTTGRGLFTAEEVACTTALVAGGVRIAAQPIDDVDGLSLNVRFSCTPWRDVLRDISIPLAIEITHPRLGGRSELDAARRLWIVKDLFVELQVALAIETGWHVAEASRLLATAVN